MSYIVKYFKYSLTSISTRNKPQISTDTGRYYIISRKWHYSYRKRIALFVNVLSNIFCNLYCYVIPGTFKRSSLASTADDRIVFM